MLPGEALPQDDQKILEMVKKLCYELNIRKISPKGVSWVDRIGARQMFPGYVFFIYGNIRISKTLLGKLTLEELRPIIVSSLIFFGRLRRKVFLATEAVLLPFAAILSALLVLLFRSSGSSSLFTTRFVLLVLAIGVFAAAYASVLRYQKRMWLRADQEAAKLVGNGPLIASLRKVVSVIEGQEVGKAGIGRPSLEERIQHLSNP